MHRFYLPPECCRESLLRLDGREAHHALHVLRLKRDDEVTVLDGAGGELTCKIEATAKDSLSLRVLQNSKVPALPCSITLLVGIPKGKIIDSIIQKAVELGARRIVPLLTERVVTQLDGEGANHKRDKWQQVAIEAIKQCGTAWLPTVEAPQSVDEFLAQNETFDLALIGSLQTERRHPAEIFSKFKMENGRDPKSVAIWIGPEGDFTLDELKKIEAAGALPITLGRLVLRVETAAVYCLSLLNYELNVPRTA